MYITHIDVLTSKDCLKIYSHSKLKKLNHIQIN